MLTKLLDSHYNSESISYLLASAFSSFELKFNVGMSIGKGFLISANRILTRHIFFSRFVRNECSRCRQVISSGELVIRVDTELVYHRFCFACVLCGHRFEPGQHYALSNDGLPYCPMDFKRHFGKFGGSASGEKSRVVEEPSRCVESRDEYVVDAPTCDRKSTVQQRLQVDNADDDTSDCFDEELAHDMRHSAVVRGAEWQSGQNHYSNGWLNCRILRI